MTFRFPARIFVSAAKYARKSKGRLSTSFACCLVCSLLLAPALAQNYYSADDFFVAGLGPTSRDVFRVARNDVGYCCDVMVTPTYWGTSGWLSNGAGHIEYFSHPTYTGTDHATYTLGLGAPSAGGLSLTGGWMLQRCTPTPVETENYLTSWGGTVTGFTPWIIGGGFGASGGGTAFLFGAGFPIGVSASGGYGIRIY